ncbi:hypothetical protein L1987_25233 [Smallanthus sonchifolius]|uniref:Uncharacterized protein n=1 Tax=Smallanthus sonchifolius TaxID=185202 RepID=A0ACB9IQB3_9ASTR|nr:hypothetical protein L1987_25233 [Smallanthus sonchifolius]
MELKRVWGTINRNMKGNTELERANLELYLRNCQLIHENDRLRRNIQEMKQKRGDPNSVKEPEAGLQLSSSSKKEEKSSKADGQN